MDHFIDKAITSTRLRRHGLKKHMGVFSHTTPAERLALYQIAKCLPAGARALEIGSHIGSSALFICAGLEYGGGHLFCVDTWMNQTMPDGEKDTFWEFQNNTKPYAPIITAVRKFSYDLTRQDIGGPLDFAFIDGDHSEIAVRRDFELIAPWVKPSGIIALHDVSAAFPGVNIVLGEALASGVWKMIKLVGCLGVIQKVTVEV